jgi:hypothetical protein
MKLKLSKGYVTVVDNDDPKNPWIFKWTAHVYRFPNGEIRNVYAFRRTHGKTIALHRFLLGIVDPKIKVDHKDGNGLNNRRSNIRKATHAQNQQNRGKQRNNTSGYKGVTWQQQKGQKGWWKAQITVDGVKTYLGLFNSKREAYTVYKEASKSLSKNFHKS